MEKIYIEGVITRGEYVRITFTKLLRSRYYQFLLIIGFLCLIVGVNRFIFNDPDKYRQNEIGWAMMIFVLGPMFLYYRSLKTYNTTKIVSDNAIYEIDNESIKFISQSVSFHYNWESLYKIERINRYLLIYTNNVQVYIIPTNRLNIADFDKLITIIRLNAVYWKINIKV